jgi:hypothetical protein
LIASNALVDVVLVPHHTYYARRFTRRHIILQVNNILLLVYLPQIKFFTLYPSLSVSGTSADCYMLYILPYSLDMSNWITTSSIHVPITNYLSDGEHVFVSNLSNLLFQVGSYLADVDWGLHFKSRHMRYRVRAPLLMECTFTLSSRVADGHILFVFSGRDANYCYDLPGCYEYTLQHILTCVVSNSTFGQLIFDCSVQVHI